MHFFLSYLFSRRRTILLLVASCAVFAIVFSLYRLPLAAVGYAALICLFLTSVVTVLDFFSFARRHRTLTRLLNEIALSVEHLPKPDDRTEADYQMLLQTVHSDKLRLLAEADRREKERADYYTLWVHQIKTPIAAMHLLLQSGQTSDGRELSEELQRIEQYVEMVLAYLRLDADSTDYLIREYDLDTIVRRAVRKFASQFIRRKISLEYEPLNVSVLTDEKWLSFVIEQLLSNALKYTKAGSVTVTLEAAKMLCIRDSGIGIAPEDLPRVFEAGYTGYNGRIDRQSSGIGLSLCARICRRLGHTIRIESTVGQGTTVRLGLESRDLRME